MNEAIFESVVARDAFASCLDITAAVRRGTEPGRPLVAESLGADEPTGKDERMGRRYGRWPT